MICEYCGCFFCWDEADEGGTQGGVRKRYCSRTCQKHGAASWSRNLRKRRRLAACTARGKTSYPTERDAFGGAAKFERLHGGRIYTYECPCGAWHLTSEPPGADEKAIALKRALFNA
jgi:hypothetical protein